MTHNDCSRALEIRDALDAGAALPDAERLWLTRHQEQCAACRAEMQVLSTLALTATDQDHFPADTLSDRRMVQQVLAAHAQTTVTSPTWIVAGWRWLLGGGLALGAAAAALVVWLPSRPSELTPNVLLWTASAEREPLSAREGQTLTTDRDELALALGERLRMLIAPHTTVELSRLHASVELELLRGRLFLEVNPAAAQVPVAVVTEDGRLEVKGTIFEVVAADTGAELSVLRGVVDVVRPGQARTRVSRQQLKLRHTQAPIELPASEAERLRTASRRVNKLGVAMDAHLSVTSSPAGALVRVDNEVLGPTPLFALLRPGSTSLEVSAAGYTSVTEALLVRPGMPVSRNFVLAPQLAPAGTPAAAAVEQPGDTKSPRAWSRQPSKPSKTSEEFLGEAQAFRAEQRWREAAESYRAVIAQENDGALAQVASVSLAGLLLEHLKKPREALKLCSAYLTKTPNGTVAEEASLCEIQALQQLHRGHDEATRIERFLARFKDSAHANSLQARLTELRADGGR